MTLIKNLFLLTALSAGVVNAGTIPCNGFKIDFKNTSNQTIVLDRMNFTGGSLNTTDPTTMGVNKHLEFTVNQSSEDGVLNGEFLFHTTTAPAKELKVNFSLTNKAMTCEVSDIAKQGTLNTNPLRILGGIHLPISE